MVVISIATTSCDHDVVVQGDRSAAGIVNVGTPEVVAERYYDLAGRRCEVKPRGPHIVKRMWSDGTVSTEKRL